MEFMIGAGVLVAALAAFFYRKGELHPLQGWLEQR